MTTPPVNSEEDFYMDEPFDDELPSEVEDGQEYEEGEPIDEQSDSQSDTDVEAEFLRGNPHARRQQIFANRSGGGSGFVRQTKMTYASSSSEDESGVVITKTVVEVNKSMQLTDDETMSVRTLIPSSAKNGSGHLTELESDDNELTEVEDEMENEMAEEAEIVSDNEYDGNDLESEKDDLEIEQLEDDEEQEGDIVDVKLKKSTDDLVDVEDANESETDETAQNDIADIELRDMTMPDNQNVTKRQKKKRGHQYHPNLLRKPIVDEDAPLVPKLENIYDDNGEEVYNLDEDGLAAGDPLNVKFLEQQMTQMSEMIMKTFRLNGGSADNSALEQLALATKLMKKQGKKLSELDVDEEADSMVSDKTSATVLSEKVGRGNCRCPSTTDINESEQDVFLMDECGQGDGLLRYSHHKQSQSARINSQTPSSFNSDNTGYHVDLRRPRSVASSEVNYKNLGRKSFSFTNPQVREIERQNNILLKKMMNVKPTIKPTINATKSSTNLQTKKQAPPAPRLTSAAVNRKKYQRQIDLDNDVLKRKLEAVGSRRPIFK
ncbi:protein hemingway [Drosophila montana]|uniref:protein hemingway n=1 Tax=Drosophila montana TaxID=40370 RepID=UPI00313C71E3